MEKKLILVGGMSGAGISTVMSILEDMGYTCIEKMPVALLDQFVEFMKNTNEEPYQNVALSAGMLDFPETYKKLLDCEIPCEFLFLNASDEVIVSRYKFTKHKHPMILSKMATTLDEAIAEERKLFASIDDFVGAFLDTTTTSVADNKHKLEDWYSLGKDAGFTITFVSFGYKYGIPKDADCLFDVRFLPNPYWIEELRNLNGDDQKVYNYVMSCEETKEYLQRLCDFLEYLFDQYHKEGRNHLTVGIGCTGGQHRSMTLVNYLYTRYNTQYHCMKEHRVKKEKAQ